MRNNSFKNSELIPKDINFKLTHEQVKQNLEKASQLLVERAVKRKKGKK